MLKVTQAALIPTAASRAAGRPGLTPELLAATGARYSRNNEGLDAILARLDPNDLDRSVDAIFRMVDYGHQSIADMVPVCLFIDGVSQWLAYLLWSLCPTASGQESSTRYLKLHADALPAPEDLGIAPAHADAWRAGMDRAFTAYREALELWEGIFEENPAVARIPAALLADASEKGKRQVARMRRNYAFDRARYFLPAAASTNVMLLMSARGWTGLCQHLLSHPLPEPQRLGAAIVEELQLAAPRMLKHAVRQDTTAAGIAREFDRLAEWAKQPKPTLGGDIGTPSEHPSGPALDCTLPPGESISEADLADDLRQHAHRYAWIGENLRRVSVRFGWAAMAFAEIRDLNRHRTGNKWCPLLPRGFYGAGDQLPPAHPHAEENRSTRLRGLLETGRDLSATARHHLSGGDPAYVYWTLLGTQFPFEHVTTADKFLYEAELRTGAGAHYRYAAHLRDVLARWYERFPATRGLIHEGEAEPE